MNKNAASISLAVVISLMAWTALRAIGTREESKALVARAIAYYRANGKEKAFAEISNPSGLFIKGDLYIVVYDVKGVCRAHGFSPRLIDKNMGDAEDSDGKLYVKEILDIAGAKGSGWLSYKFANPATYRIEKKTAYVEKADEYVFVCSAYE